jgi:hypothetical protein
MNNVMYDLIADNYNELFKTYTKYGDKNKMNNSFSCEDYFNEKILYFMEQNVEDPTIELLNLFLKTKRKAVKHLLTVEYKDYHTEEPTEEEIIVQNLRLLFLDYRPTKKNTTKCQQSINQRKKRTTTIPETKN